MAVKKIVFVAFAGEDEQQLAILRNHSLHTRSPYEYVYFSVKEPFSAEWKRRVQRRIRRSDGVIVLVSKNSLVSLGQYWEINCAKEARKKIRGIWAYPHDTTSLEGVAASPWDWDRITAFVDALEHYR